MHRVGKIGAPAICHAVEKRAKLGTEGDAGSEIQRVASITIRAKALSQIEVWSCPMDSFDAHDPFVAKRTEPGVVGSPVKACFLVDASVLVPRVEGFSLGATEFVNGRVASKGNEMGVRGLAVAIEDPERVRGIFG